jgi:hypothetical protein
MIPFQVLLDSQHSEEKHHQHGWRRHRHQLGQQLHQLILPSFPSRARQQLHHPLSSSPTTLWNITNILLLTLIMMMMIITTTPPVVVVLRRLQKTVLSNHLPHPSSSLNPGAFKFPLLLQNKLPLFEAPENPACRAPLHLLNWNCLQLLPLHCTEAAIVLYTTQLALGRPWNPQNPRNPKPWARAMYTLDCAY